MKKNCQKILILLLTCFSFSAFSYTYTAFPINTGEGNLIINPCLYAGKGFTGNNLSLVYGISDKIDLWSSISVNFNDDTNGTPINSTTYQTTLRYDFGNNNMLAAVIGSNYFSPQYHLVLENKVVGLQVNLAGKLNYSSIKNTSGYAIVSPFFKVFGGAFDLLFNNLFMDVFCEINPGYYSEGDFANSWVRPKGFGLDIVPNIDFGFGNNVFILACPVYDVTHNATPSVGVMWLYIIDTKTKK